MEDGETKRRHVELFNRQVVIYALQCGTQWLAWPDTGSRNTNEPANNTAGQADALVP